MNGNDPDDGFEVQVEQGWILAYCVFRYGRKPSISRVYGGNEFYQSGNVKGAIYLNQVGKLQKARHK